MDIKLPKLGENIEEAQVLRVMVSAGDEIEMDQSVIEIETDKATVEVPSPAAGTLEDLKVSEGDTVKVGQSIGTIKESDKSEGADKEEDKDRAEDKEKKEDQEKKEEGTKEKTAEPEPEAKDDEDDEQESKDPKEEKSEEPPPTTGAVPVFAAPSVRTFSREIGVDVRNVQGSGPGGRISIEDVKRYARVVQTGGGTPQQAGARSAPLPDFSQWGEVERIDMSGIRRRTAEHVGLSWSTMPHVTLFEKADSTDLEKVRQRYKEGVEKESSVRLTLTAMLLRIVASGLKVHPEVAASADVAKGQIVRKRYCHLGVAVDTPRGLLVPVLRDVDQKSITQVSEELDDMAGKARDGKLKMNDMSGGVFTLTNLGGLGTGFFTPIINFPEGAILGVGRATMEPVYDEDSGDFKPRLMMPLSLSFDHRLIDGADGARFLHWLVQAIEDPILMAL